MNFLKNLALQFWPLVLMATVIWTLPEKYHQAVGHGWVALLAGFMIAGGVILWSMASRAALERTVYRASRDIYIQGLRLQIDYTVRGQSICRMSNIPGLVEAYGELLCKQKELLRNAEGRAKEEDGG